MQWTTTYAAEIYAKDRQAELRAMANAARQDEKAARKTRRNFFASLRRSSKVNVDIRNTTEMKPANQVR